MKGGAEGGGEAIVGWGVEAEEVDALRGLSAGYMATRGDGKVEERWNGRHCSPRCMERRNHHTLLTIRIYRSLGSAPSLTT